MKDLFTYVLSSIHKFGIISWKDPLEIAFFSILMYRFLRWLKADTSKPLVFYFYAHAFTLLGAYAFQFPTIANFLMLYAPVIFLLLIVVHQELLQRNFVALKKIVPVQSATVVDWIELLIRICLRTKKNKATVTFLIERTDTMKPFIDVPFELEAPVSEELFAFLLSSQAYDCQKMIILSDHGKIVGLNATWKDTIDQAWCSREVLQSYGSNASVFLVHAIAVTKKTDAIFFSYSVSKDGEYCTIIAQGKLLEEVSASNALRILRYYVNGNRRSQIDEVCSREAAFFAEKSVRQGSKESF